MLPPARTYPTDHYPLIVAVKPTAMSGQLAPSTSHLLICTYLPSIDTPTTYFVTPRGAPFFVAEWCLSFSTRTSSQWNSKIGCRRRCTGGLIRMYVCTDGQASPRWEANRPVYEGTGIAKLWIPCLTQPSRSCPCPEGLVRMLMHRSYIHRVSRAASLRMPMPSESRLHMYVSVSREM